MLKFLENAKENDKYRIGNLPGGSRAYFLLEILQKGFDAIAIAEDEDDSLMLEDNMKALAEFFKTISADQVVLFPQNDLWQMSIGLGAITGSKDNVCVITTEEAYSRPLPKVDDFNKAGLKININDLISRENFIKSMSGNGYNRVDFVESKGEFACRGEIIDVWSVQCEMPCRVLFCENKVESIREFDVYTQRSGNILLSTRILPVIAGGTGTLADFIAVRNKKIIDISECAKDFVCGISGYTVTYNNLDSSETIDLGLRGISNFNRDMGRFCGQLEFWKKEGFKVSVFSHTAGEEERLKELIYARDNSLVEYPAWHIGGLINGFEYPAEKTAVVSNGEVFSRFQRSIRQISFGQGRKLDAVSQLKRGDYVVHKLYGIGRYIGLKTIKTLDNIGEYITMEYKNQDKLYVPVEDFSMVQKYVGVEGKRPRIYSLDGFSWERAKLKVKKGVEQLAKELLKTAAARALKKGNAFGEDSYLEKEFEHQFPYQETPDQARSIMEIKQDMMAARPMDRLLCGDVGYGKTEVALRAALKAVVGSKQAAVLVPTTILAEQHFLTFSERFADFPVKIEMLSRFRSQAEQKNIVEDLKNGIIDIIIGTHRLLQQDVRFKNLGLLIVDEEQRFGVKDKEKIKKIKENIDILTMTATPIPRTLYMGFAGVKDLSIIETPPEGRHPIITHVGIFSEELIKRAFYMELNRSGQIFYVYNRVETIDSKKHYLRMLFPDVRFAHVHGQMRPSEIEKTMYLFHKGDYDCLIATSIIESGLDIPRVNTLIVENAQDLGLAQLYQIRGRVGRQSRQAYCYLFYEKGKVLTEEARKRLEALKEFTELGSGFKLALRDLEIRGAGNIIGRQQHGFVNEVGFDFYAQLLKEEIERLQGKSTAESEEDGPELHLSMPAFIPEEYIPLDTERITYYKKFLRIKKTDDAENIKGELLDRFGKWGGEVENLFRLLDLRIECRNLGVKSLTQQGQQLIIGLLPEHRLDLSKITKLAYAEPDNVQFQQKKEVFSIKYNNFFQKGVDIEKIKNFLYKLV